MEEKTVKTLEELLEELRKTPSGNLTFIEANGIPTRYGRDLFGCSVKIICMAETERAMRKIILTEPIILNEEVYRQIKETGSATND